MIIEYGCVQLRPIEDRDAELLMYFMNSAEIEARVAGWHLPVSLTQQKEWIQSYRNDDKNIRLMIELTNGNTIGLISLSEIDWKNRTAGINYKVSGSTKERIRNDMHDAIVGMLNYAFDELNLNTITGAVLEDNIFSLKLIKKIGFTQEGVLRSRIFKGGKYKGKVQFSMLKSEFSALYKMNHK